MSPKETKARARAVELSETFAEPRNVTVRVNANDDRSLPPTWMTEEIRVDELQIWQYGPLLKIMHGIGDAAEQTPDIMFLAAEHSEELFRAVALATSTSVDHVSRIAASDFIKLAFDIYDVNRDFFVRNLGSRVDAVTATVMGMMRKMTTAAPLLNGDGNTPSPSFDAKAESSIPKGSH